MITGGRAGGRDGRDGKTSIVSTFLFFRRVFLEGSRPRHRNQQMRIAKKSWNGGLIITFGQNHQKLCPIYENYVDKTRFWYLDFSAHVPQWSKTMARAFSFRNFIFLARTALRRRFWRLRLEKLVWKAGRV